MGATLAQSQAAMKLAASYKPSLTHPGQQDRVRAIAAGWNNAGGPGKDMGKYSKPVSPANINDANNRSVARKEPQQQRSVVINENRNYPSTARSHEVLDSKYILGTVNFPSDRTGDYYVTIRYNLVKVMNGQLYIVGKMQPTNNANYPFIITGKTNLSLFVDRYGKILTAKKQLAGYIKI